MGFGLFFSTVLLIAVIKLDLLLLLVRFNSVQRTSKSEPVEIL